MNNIYLHRIFFIAALVSSGCIGGLAYAATQNAADQKYTNNADGFSLGGGTTARTLVVTGADVTLTGSGTNTYNFPTPYSGTTATLVGVDETQTLTHKTWNGDPIGVAYGGTGGTTLTGMLKGNGASAISAVTGTINYGARWTDANTLGTGVVYDNGTNVGIGMTAPVYTLDVTGSARYKTAIDDSGPYYDTVTAGHRTGFFFASGGVSSWQIRGNPVSGDGDINFYSYKLSDWVLNIGGDGNVGIGTMVPVARLDVKPSSGASDVGVQITQTLTSGTSFQSLFRLKDKNGTDVVLFETRGSDGATRLSSTGAWTTTSAGDVWGYRYLTSASAAQGVQAKNLVLETAYSTDISGYASNTIFGGKDSGDSLTLESTAHATKGNIVLSPTSGNVGIGSTVPNALLDVAGTARLRGAAGGTGLYVNSSGNVGIGTAAPRNSLDVNGSASGIAGIYLNSAVPSTTTNTLYNNGGALTWNGSAVATGGSSGWTSDSSTKTTTAYNVGIGTTAPQQQFSVTTVGGTGQISLESDGSSTYNSYAYSNTSTSGATFQTKRGRGTIASPLPINSGDSIGKFNFFGAYNNGAGVGVFTTAQAGLFAFAEEDFTDSSHLGTYFILRTTPSGSGTVRESLRISGSGNIGINSSSPTARLEVDGIGTTSATTALMIRDSAGTARLAVLDNGNVGIASTAPGALLDVDGSVYGNVARFGSASNYTQFEDDGTLSMAGNATVWNDLVVPGLMVRTQGSSDPTLDIFQTPIRAYAFADGVSNEVFLSFQMSHAYKEGTDIYPHVHFAPNNTNTGSVRWCIDYSWSNINSAMPASTTSCVNTAASGTQFDNQIGSLGTLSGTGKKISSILVARLYREGGNGADTYNDKAFLLSVDLHYEADTEGSREPLTK